MTDDNQQPFGERWKMRIFGLGTLAIAGLLVVVVVVRDRGVQAPPGSSATATEEDSAQTTLPLPPTTEPLTPTITLIGSSTSAFTGTLSPVEASIRQTPTSGVAPLMVNFTADASTSSGGQILSYQWIFGDGFEAEDVQTSHTYQAGGIYVVRLIVSDSNGFESVAESQVMVTRDDGVQGELVDYVLDPGFERDDNGFENYYNISSTERSGEHSIEGEISLRASFPGWSNVILPVDYPWSEGPNGYSLVASAQVRVDEMSSETSAELCAVAYWSTGSGEARHESCTDLPQPGSEVVIVRAVLELDPEVPLNRIHFWLAYPHVGEATITIDDAHLVLDKVAS